MTGSLSAFEYGLITLAIIAALSFLVWIVDYIAPTDMDVLTILYDSILTTLLLIALVVIASLALILSSFGLLLRHLSGRRGSKR